MCSRSGATVTLGLADRHGYAAHMRTVFRSYTLRVGLILAAILTGISFSSPAAAYGCGDTSESQWTGPVASVWTGEAFVSGTPYDVAVVLTNAGNEAVFIFTDTLGTFTGQFDWDQSPWDMAWYGDDSPYTERFTMFVDGATCGLNNRVTYATGETWTYSSGYVGSFTMTRVV